MVKWNRKCIWVVAIVVVVVVHSIVKVMLSRTTILGYEMRWERDEKEMRKRTTSDLSLLSSDHTLTHHREQSLVAEQEKKWRRKYIKTSNNKYSDD